VAITAATKPVAILRIMVLSLWESNRTVPIELQPAAQSLASEAELEGLSIVSVFRPPPAS
jgi:hypothetical protein